MTKLQEIKDEYARELGADSFYDAERDWRWGTGISLKINEFAFMEEVCRRYATACCKATQENISKQFGGEPFFINKVMAPDNIVLL